MLSMMCYRQSHCEETDDASTNNGVDRVARVLTRKTWIPAQQKKDFDGKDYYPKSRLFQS